MRALSTVIITYNEENNIERCLLSVLDISDEVIVLDSFSTDATKDICNKYKVKFFQHAFDGHIEQKNRVITYASNDFVLSLDADEVVSDELKKSIIWAKTVDNADGYTFNRLNNYCGSWIRHCGWYPDKKLRLWNRTLGTWSGVNPHDRYQMIEKSMIKHLQGDLLHYSYHSISQHILQVEKFTNIASKADYDRGRRTHLFKLIFYPTWKFMRDYIFKLGFLDGYAGYLVCRISAQAAFYKEIKIRELSKK